MHGVSPEAASAMIDMASKFEALAREAEEGNDFADRLLI